MFDAAHIEIDGQPLLALFGDERIFSMRTGISQKIPGRAGPLRHRVRFTLCGAAAVRTLRVHPLFDGSEGRLTRAGRLVALDFGQTHRKVLFGYRHEATIDRAMHDGYGFAPISLPRKHPVAKLVIDGRLAESLFLEPADDRLAALRGGHSREPPGVEHGALSDGGLFLDSLFR